MKFIQTNKSKLRNSKNYELAFKAYSGSYGYYSKSTYINKSEKAMIKEGFELVDEKDDRIYKLESLALKRKKRLENFCKKQKLAERAAQVKLCLKKDPISIVDNEYFENGLTPVISVANLSGTGMIEAYRGCGKGTAYVKKKKLIAFHYGYERPSNAPLNSEVYRISLSSTQICFI